MVLHDRLSCHDRQNSAQHVGKLGPAVRRQLTVEPELSQRGRQLGSLEEAWMPASMPDKLAPAPIGFVASRLGTQEPTRQPRAMVWLYGYGYNINNRLLWCCALLRSWPVGMCLAPWGLCL